MLVRGYFGKVIIRRCRVVRGEIDPQGQASCLAEPRSIVYLLHGCIIDERDQRVLLAFSLFRLAFLHATAMLRRRILKRVKLKSLSVQIYSPKNVNVKKNLYRQIVRNRR